MRNNRATAYVISFCILLGVGAGCHAPQQELRLQQPGAPAAQRDMTLSSNWVYSNVDGGRRRCVLAFPLPGAQDGPRDFLIFVSLPEREGKFDIDPSTASDAFGFFVQTVGDRKGKSTLSGGNVALRHSWMTLGRTQLDLAATCGDGTTISGRVTLQENAEEVRAFMRRYAADISLLEPAASRPATPPREPILGPDAKN